MTSKCYISQSSGESKRESCHTRKHKSNVTYLAKCTYLANTIKYLAVLVILTYIKLLTV